MSFNGQQIQHGETVGYVVAKDGSLRSLCHGFHDPTKAVLLAGEPATLFTTRREANAAIKRTLDEHPAMNEEERSAAKRRFCVIRVARPSGN